jgi:hypothetical protein
MSEYLVATGLTATILFVPLTFLRIRLATSFRDFAVFIASIIAAVASTFVQTGGERESIGLAAGIFLYFNALWFYGVESAQQPSRKSFFTPSAPRIFIGLLLFVIASWLTFSGVDSRIALIIILASILLATYKVRTLGKE